MTSLKTCCLAAAPLILLLSGAAAKAGVVLDGVHLVGVDGSGSYAGGIFSTTGCCAGMSVYVGSVAVANQVVPVTGATPDDTWLDLAYTVPDDATTHIVLESSYFYPTYGTELFFNAPFGTGNVGASGPSVVAYLDDSNNLASSFAPNAVPDWADAFYAQSGGGLSFTDGTETVTLSNYQVTSDDVNGDASVAFDLTATDSASAGAPEPGTLLL